ncbi:MAG: phytase [Planctomycetota bacterium]
MRLGRSSRRRVLFSANNGVNVVMYQPLSRRLRADARVAQYHTAYLGHHRRHERGAGGFLRSFYAAHGIHDGILPRRLARFLPVDLYVSANFSERLHPKFARRSVQIFHGVSFKNYSIKRKALRYDRLFLPGQYHLRKFIESGLFEEGDERLKLIGLPKLDRLRDGSLDRTTTLERLDLDAALPTVLYAPTGDAGNSLFRSGQQILDELLMLPVNLIVKPHDHADLDPECSIDWNRRLQEMRAPRFAAVFDADVVPLLHAADLLVTDASSVANEYTLLDRPIIFMDVPEILDGPNSKGFDLETWGRQGGEIAKEPAELRELVPQLLANPEQKSEIRRRIAQDLFHDPGRATERAVAALYEEMDLEPPVLLAGTSPARRSGSALGIPGRAALAALAAVLLVAALIGFLRRDPAAADVRAVVETVLGGISCGDSADPAIWVHPSAPELSLILGADESGGLAVYDLGGELLQCLENGRINAVDLRPAVPLGGTLTTLILGAETEHEQLVFYTLNAVTRLVEELPDARFNVGVDPEEVCLYQSRVDGTLFAFVSGEDLEQQGRFWVEQYRIFERPTVPLGMERIRRLEFDSQAEGLVADDHLGHLYVAEQDVGIWKLSVNPQDKSPRTRIDSTGLLGNLFCEVDGLTLSCGGEAGGYLIASSAGSDDFVVYRRLGENEFVGRFEIISANGIDAVTDAGGIDLVSAPMGSRFSEGLFVSEDERDDSGSSNFKLVAWRDITLSLAIRS